MNLVTNFNRVRASAVSNHLVKTASKSVHPFGWNFVHKKTVDTQTDRHTHRHTHRQTAVKIQPTISWRCKKIADLPTLFFCGLKPGTNLFLGGA